MKDSTIIDKIYAGLLSSASNPDYGFEALQGRWGYKTSDGYNDKECPSLGQGSLYPL